MKIHDIARANLKYDIGHNVGTGELLRRRRPEAPATAEEYGINPMRRFPASLPSLFSSSSQRETQTRKEERNTEKIFTIDLTKISGKGNVKCPRCGIEISPDDTSDDTYTILKPVVKGDYLDRIVLQCNNCRSRIKLVGFDFFNKKAN